MAAYTEALCEKICRKIAGSSFGLRRICKELGQPYDTVKDWIYKDQHGFAAQYEHAKQLQQDHIAEEILEIADDDSRDPETQTVQRARLRIEARKWLLTNLATRKSSVAADKTKDLPDKTADQPRRLVLEKFWPGEQPNKENSDIQKTGGNPQNPSFAASVADKAMGVDKKTMAIDKKITPGQSKIKKVKPSFAKRSAIVKKNYAGRGKR